VLRTSAVGLVVACAFAGASVALGQQGTTSNPEELWNAYPLEQRPETQAPPPAAQQRPSVVTTEEDDSGASLWWFVVAAAGAALVLVAVASERRRRARPRRAESELLLPASWPAPPPTRPRQTRRPSGPVCQVRWSRTGSFFFAVTTDPDGTEREIARSPRVDWNGSAPPDQEPEFEAAVKVLSKQVRDLGWRPLRARGVDFDERRWYARRFRWPTEAEGQRPTGGDAPGREQVGTHAKKGDA
jgi:hypothetical protein